MYLCIFENAIYGRILSDKEYGFLPFGVFGRMCSCRITGVHVYICDLYARVKCNCVIWLDCAMYRTLSHVLMMG